MTVDLEIPRETTQKWQRIVDLIATIVQVPSAAITRLDPPDLVILTANHSSANPFKCGDRVRVCIELYCETVMTTRQPLCVPNAVEDERWLLAPSRKFGLVAYYGIPLCWPNGSVFGTICVLDDKANSYCQLHRELLDQFHDVVEADLRLIFMHNAELTREALAKAELTAEVSKRTAMLARANIRLRRHIAERRKIAEDRLRLLLEEQRARAAAEEAVRMRDEFLSIASHELYTPITSLNLAVQAMSRGGQLASSRLVGLAERQCQRLAKLVEDLLSATRAQVGKLELQREDVDLLVLCQQVVARLEVELEQARTSVAWKIDGPARGAWDRSRIEQVVTNLVLNAMKYGAGRTIEMRLGATSEKATLTVADQGIGIPPERLPHIFDRFERGVSPRHYGGLGLGLYITREIVLAHGGSIRVSSELGVGSVFTVELPVTAPAGAVFPSAAAFCQSDLRSVS
jgi:signal transduction histidine kinase